MIHEYYPTLGFGWINVGYYVFASRRVGLIVIVLGGWNGLADECTTVYNS